jgi:hypothetical protein
MEIAALRVTGAADEAPLFQLRAHAVQLRRRRAA